MLIAFEGIDGSGKNTQIEKLVEFFVQHRMKYRLHKFPTRKAMDAFEHLEGRKNIPRKELADIFAKDIMGEMPKIREEISEGCVVICDRYLHSTLAYQSAEGGYGELSKRLGALGAVGPDLVLIFDIDPKTALARKSSQKTPDRFEEDIEFLEKVRGCYKKIARDYFLSYRFAIIDASGGPDDVFSEVITRIEPLVTKLFRN